MYDLFVYVCIAGRVVKRDLLGLAKGIYCFAWRSMGLFGRLGLGIWRLCFAWHRVCVYPLE